MIYAFPVVALSSITVRITGVLLTGGMGVVGAGALVGMDPGATMASLGDSSLAPLCKLCVSFPLSYHFIGGVRHAIWDAQPEHVTNEKVEQWSFALAGASLVTTAGIMLM